MRNNIKSQRNYQGTFCDVFGFSSVGLDPQATSNKLCPAHEIVSGYFLADAMNGVPLCRASFGVLRSSYDLHKRHMREIILSNNDTLLEYYVALNWAREIVGNIDNGAATFQVTASDGQVSDGTLDIRECQLRMI